MLVTIFIFRIESGDLNIYISGGINDDRKNI